MTTIKVFFKHNTQVGDGIITGLNHVSSEITGGSLEYWNKYKDERAKEILSQKLLEATYGYTKANEMIITKVEIN